MAPSDNLPLAEPNEDTARLQPHGSSPTEALSRSLLSAINCNSGLTLLDYLERALSPNTKKAYGNDLRDFLAWGGSIPASPRMIAEYLADRAQILAVSTLKRRLAALSVAHQQSGDSSPTSHPLVRATMRGIARYCGSAQWRVRPILKENLFAILDATGETLRDLRDRALLLIGFAAALRRSEIAALNVQDFQFVEQGLLVVIRRSKTDPTGQGRAVAIPYGRERWCPVVAQKEWLQTARLTRGAAFVSISKSGELSSRLSDRTIAEIIKFRAASIGFPASEISGHSLRAGFVTSAARAGVPTWKIRAQTGHKSEAVLARYIRELDPFTGNASGCIL